MSSEENFAMPATLIERQEQTIAELQKLLNKNALEVVAAMFSLTSNFGQVSMWLTDGTLKH